MFLIRLCWASWWPLRNLPCRCVVVMCQAVCFDSYRPVFVPLVFWFHALFRACAWCLMVLVRTRRLRMFLQANSLHRADNQHVHSAPLANIQQHQRKHRVSARVPFTPTHRRAAIARTTARVCRAMWVPTDEALATVSTLVLFALCCCWSVIAVLLSCMSYEILSVGSRCAMFLCLFDLP